MIDSNVRNKPNSVLTRGGYLPCMVSQRSDE